MREEIQKKRSDSSAKRFASLFTFLRVNSLAWEVVWETALWGILIMLAVTGAGYYHTFKNQESQTLEELKLYVASRVEHEESLFALAKDSLQVFEKEYLKLYTSGIAFTDEEFDEFFFRDSEGATRMREKFFTGSASSRGLPYDGMSAFIGNNQKVLSEDFKRRMLLAYFLVARLGPAWVSRFANLHTSTPENGMLCYWPEMPWGLQARADLDTTAGSVVKATLQEFNPERKPFWTGLYYDLTANHWVITYQHPIDYEGRHLLSGGIDVYLDDLMDRMLTQQYVKGATSFIVDFEKQLIAHQEMLHRAKEEKGVLEIEELENPSLSSMYRTIMDSISSEGDGPWIFFDSRTQNYLGVSRIVEPDWLFVTAYPKSLLLQSAHKAALLILGMGLLLFVAFMSTVALVLRKRVAFPVGVLEKASEAISRGNYASLGEPVFQHVSKALNEVGSLARTFHRMAEAVRDVNRILEEKVAARTSELAAANKKLEELSLLDPLTKMFNRRAFDRDLKEAFAQAREGKGTFALMLCDVDFFKQYNDTYGHDAGDEVLRDLARTMFHHVGPDDRVYRYGGEEIVIIFKSPYPGNARDMAERILEAVRKLNIEHTGCPWGILTVSAGMEEFHSRHTSPHEMIRSVDRKLYEAKGKGRNRLEV